MKTIFNSLKLLVALAIWVPVFATTPTPPLNFIYVYFLYGAERSTPPDTTAIVTSEDIQDLLDYYSIENIYVEYPYFIEEDTLFTGQYGNQIQRINLAKIFRIEVPDQDDYESVKTSLLSLQETLFIHGPMALEFCMIPDDEFFGDQWGHTGGQNNFGINTIDAWDNFGIPDNVGRDDLVIGQVDTGLDLNHAEFYGRVHLLSEEAIGENHGTLVAGVFGANANNGPNGDLGVAGVDWHSLILSRRLDHCRFGPIKWASWNELMIASETAMWAPP